MGILEGGAIALVFFFLGRINRRRGYKAPTQKKPLCGCGHHYSYHDAETKACHALVNGKAIEFDRWASRAPVAWEQVECGCKNYSGPEPLPNEYFAPEVTG